MAQSSLTFSSILSKYASSSGSAPAPAPAPAPASAPTQRPPSSASATANRPPVPPARIASIGQSRPSVSSSASAINSRLAATSISNNSNSAIRTGPNSAAPRPDNTAMTKKRKLENLPDNRPLTETDKERAERRRQLMEKMKLKKEKEAAISGSGSKSSSVPPPRGASQPSSAGLSRSSAASVGPREKPSAPISAANDIKKLSYKELLAKAAQLQESHKNAGVITHKARAPVVEKKEWQKKLEARKQQATGATADRKSKSPGAMSGGERGGLASKKPPGKETTKTVPAKRPGNDIDSRRSSVAKGKAASKAGPVEVAPVKRKRSPSPISWRGRNAAAPVKKPSRPRHGRSRYDDEDDEDDDWIVDDDEDEVVGAGYRRSYRYAESDYESDSDMEAGGRDILEEEERSRRQAIKEDIEQEKLEKELAAKKAMMKKKLVKKY